MPLDTQPLSPARKAAMVVVMLGLLGASLGFAQYLVHRRQARTQVAVLFPVPVGATDLQVNTDPRQIAAGALRRPMRVPGLAGEYFAFSFEDTQGGTPQDYASDLLERLGGDAEAHPPVMVPMAGHSGIQMESETSGPWFQRKFVLVRVMMLDSHVVAFCCSGQALRTDADRAFFDDYCTHQVRIELVPLTRGHP